MTNIARRVVITAGAVLTMAVGDGAIAQTITSNIQFSKGRTSATVKGTIVGDQTRDYVVRAGAGQTMRVKKAGSAIVYFNVLAPGSNDEAIFVGSNEGDSFSGTLSVSGAYKIRVYQMRATARRRERGAFSLEVAVTGSSGGGSGAGSSNGLAGIAGMNSIAAIDEMTNRGFRNVDSINSGNTQYGIYYNASRRICAQLTMADGKVLDAKDIRTHPKCR